MPKKDAGWHMLRSKKAQEQIQFNWIYIAVVGAIILSIFVGVALNIRRSARTSMEADTITYFDEIFVSVQASENTENSITLGGLDLEVATDSEDCNFYTIKGSELGGRSTEFIPIFSPDVIKTRILSYSLGWDMPFRVNYFLFLTSPEVAYVSIGQNSAYDELPDHITKKRVDSSDEFVNQNYYKVRFFSDDEDDFKFLDSSLKKLDEKDITGVYYSESQKILKFYEMDKASGMLEEVGESSYVDKTSLLAAIYSENLGAYECNMKKGLKRLNKFSRILLTRAENIKSSSLMPQCSDLSNYNNAIGLLQEIEEATATASVDRGDLSVVVAKKDYLKDLNRNLNRKSCPTIY
jgi:hypothetical protein